MDVSVRVVQYEEEDTQTQQRCQGASSTFETNGVTVEVWPGQASKKVPAVRTTKNISTF